MSMSRGLLSGDGLTSMDRALKEVVYWSAGLGLWAGAIGGVMNSTEPTPALPAHLKAPYEPTEADRVASRRRVCASMYTDDREAFRCEMDLEQADELRQRYAPYREERP